MRPTSGGHWKGWLAEAAIEEVTVGLRASSIPKQSWQGTLVAIQPRIRLTRSFDERSHTYLGYALRLGGTVGERRGEFLVGVGPAAHARHRLRAGDVLRGESAHVGDPRVEPVDFYKTTGLEVLTRGPDQAVPPPPWLGIPQTRFARLAASASPDEPFLLQVLAIFTLCYIDYSLTVFIFD